MNSTSPSLIRARAPLIILLALWAAGQAYLIPQKSLWNDEFFSMLAASGRVGESLDYLGSAPLVESTAKDLLAMARPDPRTGISDFLRDLAHNDIHPPAFFFFLRLWMGLGAVSGFALYLLPLLISGAGVIVFYELSAEVVQRPFHILAVALWLFSIQAIDSAAEVRQYGLLFAASAGLTLLAVKAQSRPELFTEKTFLWFFGVVTALGFLTQYMFVWLVAALNLWLLTNQAVRATPHLRGWLKANLIGLALVFPWMPLAAIQLSVQTSMVATNFSAFEIIHGLAETIVHFIITPTSLAKFPVALIAVLITAAVIRPLHPRFRSLIVIVFLVCFVVPGFLRWAGIIHVYLFKVRYLLPALPVVVISLTQGAATIPRRWAGAATGTLLLLMVAANSFSFVDYSRSQRTNLNLNTDSPFEAMGRALESQLKAPYVLAVDSRRPEAVLYLADKIAPRRTVLAGDHKTLPSALPAWASEHKRPVIAFVHKQVSLWDPEAKDVTDEVGRKLAPLGYSQLPSIDTPAWKLTMFAVHQ